MVDTGAPISVFPKKTWMGLPEVCVEWLQPMDRVSATALRVRGLLNVVAPARIGLVEVSLRSEISGEYPPVVDSPRFRILAKFMQEDSAFDRILLGMAGNGLDRWATLEISFEDETARLLARTS